MKELISFFEKIEGVVSIGLKALPSVDALSSISVEHGPLSIFLPEAFLEPLSDTIDVLAVDFCAYLEVVVTEDDCL